MRARSIQTPTHYKQLAEQETMTAMTEQPATVDTVTVALGERSLPDLDRRRGSCRRSARGSRPSAFPGASRWSRCRRSSSSTGSGASQPAPAPASTWRPTVVPDGEAVQVGRRSSPASRTASWRTASSGARRSWRSAAGSSATSPASPPRPTSAGCRSCSARRPCWRRSTPASAARSRSTTRRQEPHRCLPPAGRGLRRPRDAAHAAAARAGRGPRRGRPHGIAFDAAFFAFLETDSSALLALDADALRHAVATCCRIKAAVVAEDERETGGRRSLLNLGHTFAHALETLTGYTRYRHGEAVGWGIARAARLALKLGLCGAADAARQEDPAATGRSPGRRPVSRRPGHGRRDGPRQEGRGRKGEIRLDRKDWKCKPLRGHPLGES